jgi:hypothetical protein
MYGITLRIKFSVSNVVAVGTAVPPMGNTNIFTDPFLKTLESSDDIVTNVQSMEIASDTSKCFWSAGSCLIGKDIIESMFSGDKMGVSCKWNSGIACDKRAKKDDIRRTGDSACLHVVVYIRLGLVSRAMRPSERSSRPTGTYVRWDTGRLDGRRDV